MADEVIETITVSDFSGRLTRIQNGKMDSGFAKFVTSFGYDPFTKPRNLTWLEQPTSVAGVTNDIILDAKTRVEGGTLYAYAIGTGSVVGGTYGNVYKIQPQKNAPANPKLDSVIGITSIMSGSPTFTYGSSLEFYGSNEALYISTDREVRAKSLTNFAAVESVFGVTVNYAATYHPLKQFAGKLFFGNGNTVGSINATNTVVSSVIGTGQGNLYSDLNPPLPVENVVHDLDISQDIDYLKITASDTDNEQIASLDQDYLAGAASNGYIYGYNGVDFTVTNGTQLPSYAITALQTYLNNEYFFSSDTFGSSLNNHADKILTLTDNKAPNPNATISNGNFISWVTPEISADGTTIVAALYYYGSLDSENPVGLYRLLRYSSTLSNGRVYQTPVNRLMGNKFSVSKLNALGVDGVEVLSYGKHYISVFETSVATPRKYALLSFLVTSSGTGTPQLGVYETQTQLFSNKIAVKAVRVYTEPTTTGNGFQIDYIGSDGSVISGSSSAYSYSAGTDPTLLQGAQDRINFFPQVAPTYALGLRITNTGTTNMVIKKIEIDYTNAGV